MIYINKIEDLLYLNIEDLQSKGTHEVNYRNNYLRDLMHEAVFAFNVIIGDNLYSCRNYKGVDFIIYNGNDFHGRVIKINDVVFKEKIVDAYNNDKEIRFILNDKMHVHAVSKCESLNMYFLSTGTNRVFICPK